MGRRTAIFQIVNRLSLSLFYAWFDRAINNRGIREGDKIGGLNIIAKRADHQNLWPRESSLLRPTAMISLGVLFFQRKDSYADSFTNVYIQRINEYLRDGRRRGRGGCWSTRWEGWLFYSEMLCTGKRTSQGREVLRFDKSATLFIWIKMAGEICFTLTLFSYSRYNNSSARFPSDVTEYSLSHKEKDR